MYVNEHGSSEIMQFLNKNHYFSPTGYRKTGIVQDKNNTNYYWNEVTLCNMLKNEVYIGNTVQNKKSVVSYKVKKIRKVEIENQIRVNGTHDPIIEIDTFEKVQCILEKKGTNAKLKYDYLLRGLLYCYHCKRKLQIVLKKNAKTNAKLHAYITCSNYKERGCFPLNINYEKFETYIICIVKKILNIYADKELLHRVYETYENKAFDMRENFKKKIMQINKAILDINHHLDKMYIDKLRNIITEEDYVRISNKFTLDRTNFVKQKEKLEEKLKLSEQNLDEKNKTRNEKELNQFIEDFLRLEKIDKMYLYRFINKIEIDKDKNVYIYFNFSKLNSIHTNSDEFIKMGEIVHNTSSHCQ